MCKTFALHASGPTSKKKYCWAELFSLSLFSFETLTETNIILEKTNIILKNECKKNFILECNSKIMKKTTENFRKNQEVAAMQVEL